MSSDDQFLRQASLVVLAGDKGLDLSEMRFTFNIVQSDTQTPNNATIRVYNLSPDTERSIQGEYSRVVLQAGYKQPGVIFDGTIKQFRKGRENAIDTFFEILAADGDLFYNFSCVNDSIGSGARYSDVIKTAAKDTPIDSMPTLFAGKELLRGKVLFGMSRDVLRQQTAAFGSTWSIQDGKIQILELSGYLPGEAVVVNAATGMIGIPEQTEGGISVRCLLNPRLRVGGLVQLNNKDITALLAAKGNPYNIPFNQYAGINLPSKIADGADGLYRLYVVEHTGDTRGQPWWSDLICLLVSNRVVEAQ